MENKQMIIEIIGEGKTESGRNPSDLKSPKSGVLSIVVHKLCGNPIDMKVVFKPLHSLQKGTLERKAKFERLQAYYSKYSGIVFVVDTDGDHPNKITALKKGRDTGPNEIPMAVGVAHPCIEAWLLADAKAIHKGLELAECPNVPDQPEELPAPCKDRERNPKTELGKFTNSKRDLSAKEMSSIASNIKDLDIVRERCPRSFAPFADEVESRIKPLFDTDDSDPGTIQL